MNRATSCQWVQNFWLNTNAAGYFQVWGRMRIEVSRMTVISLWRKDSDRISLSRRWFSVARVGFNCILRSCWLAGVLEEFSPNSVSGRRRATISRLPPQQLGVAGRPGSEKLSCRRLRESISVLHRRRTKTDEEVLRYISFRISSFVRHAYLPYTAIATFRPHL